MNGDNGDVACDHFSLYEEDVKIMKVRHGCFDIAFPLNTMHRFRSWLFDSFSNLVGHTGYFQQNRRLKALVW